MIQRVANAICRVCTSLNLELTDARKSRQNGLCKLLNGNKKVRTVAETLSQARSPSAANSLYLSEGVPFDIFEGHFFDLAVFSRKADFRGFGAI